MTTLTPEELAACREIEVSVRTSAAQSHRSATAQGFIQAGLSHARAESAKEIADLRSGLETVHQINVDQLGEIEALKAQLDCNIDICKQVQAERDTLKVQVDGIAQVQRSLLMTPNTLAQADAACGVSPGAWSSAGRNSAAVEVPLERRVRNIIFVTPRNRSGDSGVYRKATGSDKASKSSTVWLSKFCYDRRGSRVVFSEARRHAAQTD